MKEERIVNPITGGEKGQKIERYDLIPVEPLNKVAQVYGEGAKKYAERNWSRGYDWGLSYASLMRHLTQFWGGESYDKESGSHHLACVVFHAFALMYFEDHYPEFDSRDPQEKRKDQ